METDLATFILLSRLVATEWLGQHRDWVILARIRAFRATLHRLGRTRDRPLEAAIFAVTIQMNDSFGQATLNSGHVTPDVPGKTLKADSKLHKRGYPDDWWAHP
jgi:hypothetical protein